MSAEVDVVGEELPPTEKRCSRCQQVKPTSAFSKDVGKPGGLRGQCKPCRTELDRTRRQIKQGKKVTAVAVVAEKERKTTARTEAHRCAILRLIDKHRSEFDALVYSEQVRLRVIDLNDQPRERWVSLN